MIQSNGMIERLRHLASGGKVPHALLFHGKRGTGKMDAAKFFAKAVLCENYGKPDALVPCGRCVSCKMFESGSHPDFHIVTPEGNKIKTIKIEKTRAIIVQSSCVPRFSSRHVFIIDEADTMQAPAANSILKTLEEPEGEAVFILLTAQKDKLLPTILSRCMAVAFFAPPKRPEHDDEAVAAFGKLPRMAATEIFSFGENFGKKPQEDIGRFLAFWRYMILDLRRYRANLPPRCLSYEEIDELKNIWRGDILVAADKIIKDYANRITRYNVSVKNTAAAMVMELQELFNLKITTNNN